MIENAENTRSKKILMLMLLIIPVIYLITLNWHGLLDPDEGRYAEVAREMIATGDFITPHLNFTKFFDKPPLSYWMTSIFFYLFGQNEFAARLGPAISGILTLSIVFMFSSAAFGKRTGYIASIILGTSLLFFALVHTVITDMALTSCVTLSLAGFYMFQRGDRRWLPAFYIGMGLGMLAKGLIGIVIPVGTVMTWTIAARDWQTLRRLFSPKWTIAALGISLPWFFAVCARNPDFFDYFFIRQHFTRYLTTADNRYEPFWFFLPIVLVGFFPWTGFLLSSVKNLKERLLLWLWVAFTLLFFSFSGSKLIPYILPVFPPISVIIGMEIDARIGKRDERKNSISTVFTVSILLIYGAAMAALPFFCGEYPFRSVAEWSIPAALTIWGGALAVVYLSNPPGNMEKVVVTLGIVGLINGICSVGLGSVYATEYSSKAVAESINRYRNRDDLIVQYGGFDQGLPFYLRQRIVLLSHSKDMDFGDAHEKDRSWFIDYNGLVKLWNGNRRIFIVADDDKADKLASILGSTTDVLQVSRRKAIISNRSFSTKPDEKTSRGSDIR